MKTINQKQALQMAYGMLRAIEQGQTFDYITWHESTTQMALAIDGHDTDVPLRLSNNSHSDHHHALNCGEATR